jgi:hypothetical protein
MEEAKHSRGLGSYVIWAFVAVMVYVLSSGPAMRAYGLLGYVGSLGRRIPIISTRGGPSWMQIYTPLEEAYRKTALHRPLGMYWHLWSPDVWNKDGDIRH